MQKKQFLRVQRRTTDEHIVNLAKRRQWYSDQGDDESADTDPLDETGNTEQTEIKMPKTKFNDRLERAKRSARNELIASLGFDDEEALKNALSKTTTDKPSGDDNDQATSLQVSIEQLNKKLADMEATAAKAQAEKTRSNQLLAIREVVKKSGARDTDDIMRFIDVDKVIDGDGINQDTLTKSITDLRNKKSYLFNVVGVPSSNDGNPSSSSDDEATKKNAKNNVRF